MALLIYRQTGRKGQTAMVTMRLSGRLSSRARLPLGLAGIGVCALCVAAGFGGPGHAGSPPQTVSGNVPPTSALTGFTASRLTNEVAAKYGFHFMSPAAPADPGGVDMATARDAGGDQLRVIVFGRTPAPVHAVSCEITPAHAAIARSAASTPATLASAPAALASAPAAFASAPIPGAVAGFLGACAQLAVGTDQSAAADRWVAGAQAALSALPPTETDPGRLTRSARIASVGYAVRRVPATGEWIMSMTGETP